MSEAAVIRVENLSKRYRIGGVSGSAGTASYGSLRESLSSAAAAPLRRLRGAPRPPPNEIWALKDISFEVHQGETLGIIGRNGAGKSTLLKILSRITKPTGGRVTLRGRVGSLLEVGTGFHPELTGRENIFLNGAILGMRRAEIERKFDQIVDFAEIEQFLDTPVKYYSSGMYMRLAFAVAAHLEPEILLVDEVLAVGDVQFQKKCLGKMGEVAQDGRTVLFVSHNMDAIAKLCRSTILLRCGQIAAHESSQKVVQIYLADYYNQDGGLMTWYNSDHGQRTIRFDRIILTQKNHLSLDCSLEYKIASNQVGAVIGVRIETVTGSPVMTLTDNDLDENHYFKKKGAYRSTFSIPTNIFAPGIYRVTISAADMKSTRYDFHEGVVTFEVPQSLEINSIFRREGPMLVPIPWKTQEIG